MNSVIAELIILFSVALSVGAISMSIISAVQDVSKVEMARINMAAEALGTRLLVITDDGGSCFYVKNTGIVDVPLAVLSNYSDWIIIGSNSVTYALVSNITKVNGDANSAELSRGETILVCLDVTLGPGDYLLKIALPNGYVAQYGFSR